MFFRQFNLFIILFIVFLLAFPLLKTKLTGSKANHSVLSMVLVSLGIGAEAYQTKRQVLIDKALTSYRAKDLEKAIGYYEQIYKLDLVRPDTPSSVQVSDLKTIARLYYENGEASKASAVLERAREQLLLSNAEFVMGNGTGQIGALTALLDLRESGENSAGVNLNANDVADILAKYKGSADAMNNQQLSELLSSVQHMKSGDSMENWQNTIQMEGLPDELKVMIQTMAAQQLMATTEPHHQQNSDNFALRIAALSEPAVNAELEKRSSDDFVTDAQKFEEAASRLRQIANMGGAFGGETTLPDEIRNNPLMIQLFPGGAPRDLNGLIKMLEDKSKVLKSQVQSQ